VNVIPWSMGVSLVGFLVEVESLGEPGGGGQVERSSLRIEEVLGHEVVGKVGPKCDVENLLEFLQKCYCYLNPFIAISGQV
jgi:hypothetical protein